MSEPFLSEIKIMSFSHAPKGWALCNGQLMPINQNQALFALLGTNYGGDGQVNFALPDLRARVQIHMGGGHILGERGGENAHTLSISEIPLHLHLLQSGAANNNANVGDVNNADQVNPVGNYWANAGKTTFSTAVPDSAMSPGTVANVGGSQPHENRSPFLTLNFCIALQGIFPSQN